MTQDFSGFGLPPQLLRALERMQFKTPTPIQEQAIPLAMQGRDILGSAQTGTGKTGAFGIPLISRLMTDDQAMGLVITPTRELAVQVMAALQQMIPMATLRTAVLIGGESMPKQYRQLEAKPRLIVGTPGRINDHLQRRSLKLGNVRYLVLDETDRMLDMGFGVQIDKILTHIPPERQTLLFSATLPAAIVKLSGKYLNNPERVSVGSTIAAAPNIKQDLIQMSEAEKPNQLIGALSEAKGSVLVFVKTKYGAEKLAKRLCQQDFKADTIHGDLKQSRRDRVIAEFRAKKFSILVATDIAARGLDVPHIETVINHDLPQCPEDYIHRIGRTARAGASGVAITFLTPADRAKWNAIHKLMNPGVASTLPRVEGDASKRGPKRSNAPRRPHRGAAPKSKPAGEAAWHPIGEKPAARHKPNPTSRPKTGQKPGFKARIKD